LKKRYSAVTKDSLKMKLNLVLLDGSTREIEIESIEENVSNFRRQVGSLLSIDVARIQLAFHGNILRDEETLSMHGLNDGNHINCVLGPESYVTTTSATNSIQSTVASENFAQSNNNNNNSTTTTTTSNANNSTLARQVSGEDSRISSTTTANNNNSNTIVLKIKLLNGTDREMEVNRSESVENFRRQISGLIGVEDVNRIRLIHMGRVLETNDLLSAYNITNGSWIHCTLRPEGAAPPSQAGSIRPSNVPQTSLHQSSIGPAAHVNNIASQINVQSLGNGVMMGSISIDTHDLEMLSASGMNIESIVNQMLISQGMRPTGTTISGVSTTTTPTIRSSDSQSGSGSGSIAGGGGGAQRRPSLIAATTTNIVDSSAAATTGGGGGGVQTTFQRFRDYPLQSDASTEIRNPPAIQQVVNMNDEERLRQMNGRARNSLPRMDNNNSNQQQSEPTTASLPYAGIPSLLQGPMLRQDSSFSALESTAGSRPQSYNFNHLTPQQQQQLLMNQGIFPGHGAVHHYPHPPNFQDVVLESNRRRYQAEAARRASMDGSVASRASRDSRASVYRLSAVDRRFQGAVESGLGSARQLATSLQLMTGTRAMMTNVGDAQVPSQAMGSMLWDLSVCMNGLQIPLATMSQRMTGDAFFADTTTMDGRVERLSELSRMRTILTNLADTANRAAEALGLLGMEVQASVPVTQSAHAPLPVVHGPVPTTAVYSNPSSVAGTPPIVPVTRTTTAAANHRSSISSMGSGNSGQPSSSLQIPPPQQQGQMLPVTSINPASSSQVPTLNLTEDRADVTTPIAEEVLSWRRALSQSTRSETEESEVFEESAVPIDEALEDDPVSPRDTPRPVEASDTATVAAATQNLSPTTTIPETVVTSSSSLAAVTSSSVHSSSSTSPGVSAVTDPLPLVTTSTTSSSSSGLLASNNNNVSNPSPLMQNQPVPTSTRSPPEVHSPPPPPQVQSQPQRSSSRDANDSRNPRNWRLFRSSGK